MRLWACARVVCGLALLVLAGCATQQSVPPLQTPEAFARAGGFTWRDAQGRLELDLTNPFGNILARIEVTGKSAVLTQSNGGKLEAATPEELVKIAVGEAIPVQGLRTWLRSQTVAGPTMTQVSRDDQRRVTGFEQTGWRIELSRFDGMGPRLLILSRQDDSKKIVIRLVIDGT